MPESGTLIADVEVLPGLCKPLNDLSAAILDGWGGHGHETAKEATPPAGLERFARQIDGASAGLFDHPDISAGALGPPPWTLIENPTTRAELIPLRAGYRVPLHDHPGCAVVLYLIRGRLILSTFQGPEGIRSGFTVSLLSLGRDLLNPGEFRLAAPRQGHTHRLSALMDALVLEVTVAPRRPEGYHRFYPLGRQSDQGKVETIAVGQHGHGPAAESCNAVVGTELSGAIHPPP